MGPGSSNRNGPPVEELAVERTELHPGEIDLTVRNDGPDAVRIAQVIVNDGFTDFARRTTPSSAASTRPRSRSATPGSRARPTTSSS